MLLSANHLLGFDLEAIDGSIGSVNDFYFDAEQWVIRYLVVDTGRILPGKKVLLSPNVLGHPQTVHKVMPANLTREKVKASPPAGTQLPVCKLEEIELHKYYNWVPYWDSDFISYPTPVFNPIPTDNDETKKTAKKIENTQIRSLEEITGYRIKTNDGQVGHIEDLIIDDRDWTIRYLVGDTRNFFPGDKVLISPEWAGDFDWATGTVAVDLTTEQVKNSPKYNPKSPINREYEIQLFDYYGRPKYWR